MRFLAGLLKKRPPQRAAFGEFVAFVADVAQRRRLAPEDQLHSDLASARLRLAIPARQLAGRIPVWLVPFGEFIERPRLDHLGRAHAVVVGKLSSREVVEREGQLRLLVAALRERPCARQFADVSDHYAGFAKASKAPFLAQYQRSLGRACELIVPTAALARALRRDARCGLHVVEDPFETPAAQPVRAWSGGPLRLAWFGSISALTLPLIDAGLRELAASFPGQEIRVEIVAQAMARSAVLAIGQRLRPAYPRFCVAFTDWSLAATDAAIEHAHFVWLPQETRQSWGQVKSHNRLVSAIRGGRLALAAPIPAYRELAAYAWVGEPLSAGLRWALAHPQEALARVREGQGYVEQRFSPEVIGRRWAQVLGLPPEGHSDEPA